MNTWRRHSIAQPSIRIQRGFSLLEMMFVISILGVLLAIGIPTFRSVIITNNIVANNNELVATLSYARSEAVKRVSPVTVCASTNNTSCAAVNDWSTGWIVFPDPNANSAVDAGETILQANGAATGGVTLNGTAGLNSVRFTGTGMLGTPGGTFTVQKPGCTGDKARQVAVAITGRATTTRVNCT